MLQHLTEDAVVHILFFLEPLDLCRLAQVNKYMSLTSCDDIFWKQLASKKYFKLSVLDFIRVCPNSQSATINQLFESYQEKPKLSGNTIPQLKLLYIEEHRKKHQMRMIDIILELSYAGNKSKMSTLLHTNFGPQLQKQIQEFKALLERFYSKQTFKVEDTKHLVIAISEHQQHKEQKMGPTKSVADHSTLNYFISLEHAYQSIRTVTESTSPLGTAITNGCTILIPYLLAYGASPSFSSPYRQEWATSATIQQTKELMEKWNKMVTIDRLSPATLKQLADTERFVAVQNPLLKQFDYYTPFSPRARPRSFYESDSDDEDDDDWI